MSNPGIVTLLYTANLAGVLALLPQLSTLIQQERRASSGPVVLLDLGDTCSLDQWVCRATHGRAPLFVLDAMGYDAALIGGPERVSIPLSSLRHLRQRTVMPVIVWNTVAHLTKQGVSFALATGDAELPTDCPGVRVDRSTEVLPGSQDQLVALGDVAQGHVARVELTWPEWQVATARHVVLAPDTPPDPTIAAVVDYVESEARYYAQQQEGNS